MTDPTDAERIRAAIAKFDGASARRIRAVRAALRNRFPTAFELVYDNYNFFVIGYSATERPSDTIVALAADANGVGLSFYRGADVPDPRGLLQGTGKQNRFIRLSEGEATLSRRDVAETYRRSGKASAQTDAGEGRDYHDLALRLCKTAPTSQVIGTLGWLDSNQRMAESKSADFPSARCAPGTPEVESPFRRCAPPLRYGSGL